MECVINLFILPHAARRAMAAAPLLPKQQRYCLLHDHFPVLGRHRRPSGAPISPCSQYRRSGFGDTAEYQLPPAGGTVLEFGL